MNKFNLFLNTWRFSAGLWNAATRKSPSLKWPHFKQHKGAARAASACVEALRALAALPVQPGRPRPACGWKVAVEDWRRSRWWRTVPTSSSRARAVTALSPSEAGSGAAFWQPERCRALAQSDIQVTLVEGNKTRLDRAGGSLQVVTGLTEGITVFIIDHAKVKRTASTNSCSHYRSICFFTLLLVSQWKQQKGKDAVWWCHEAAWDHGSCSFHYKTATSADENKSDQLKKFYSLYILSHLQTFFLTLWLVLKL